MTKVPHEKIDDLSRPTRECHFKTEDLVVRLGHVAIFVLQSGPLPVCKWSYNPYKWPYTWVTGVITSISGVITLLKTGSGAHLQRNAQRSLGVILVDGNVVAFHGKANQNFVPPTRVIIWVFPKIGVPPKHPKMIIFSRKTHGCWVPPFLETSIWPTQTMPLLFWENKSKLPYRFVLFDSPRKMGPS